MHEVTGRIPDIGTVIVEPETGFRPVKQFNWLCARRLMPEANFRIMSEEAQKALPLWELQGATIQLAALRGNQVYRVEQFGRSHAPGLHRIGCSNDDALHSELQWMDAAANWGLHVPFPIKSTSGPPPARR